MVRIYLNSNNKSGDKILCCVKKSTQMYFEGEIKIKAFLATDKNNK